MNFFDTVPLYRGGVERSPVKLVGQQELEVADADESRRQAERVGYEQGLPDRLSGGIKEKHRGYGDLRKDQRQRQQPAFERDQFFHNFKARQIKAIGDTASPMARVQPCRLAVCLLETTQQFITALNRAVHRLLRVFIA